MKILVNEVRTVDQQKGKAKWQDAVIKYSYNGESRDTTIRSFAQPEVFAAAKEMESGVAYNVTLGKNEKSGYSEWQHIEKADASDAYAPSKAPGPHGSWNKTYETPEERAARQVLIVKQSSLAQAVALNKGIEGDIPTSLDDILAVAQKFTDWVLEGNAE